MRNFLTAFAVVCCLSGQTVAAEITYGDRLAEAATRAEQKILKANAAGKSVNIAHEIMVHHDRLCIFAFGYLDVSKLQLMNSRCVEHQGSYARRVQGFNWRQMRAVRTFVLQHAIQGSSADLEGLLQYEAIFAELQELIRTDTTVRDRFIQIYVGHSGVTYVEPGTTLIQLQ